MPWVSSDLPSLDVQNGRVYWSGTAEQTFQQNSSTTLNTVLALDAATGASIWESPKTFPDSASSEAIYKDGRLYVTRGSVYLTDNPILDGGSGAVLGRIAAYQGFPPVLIADKYAAILPYGNTSAWLNGLDFKTGQNLWTFYSDLGDSAKLNTALAIDDTVFAASLEGRIYAIDSATGKRLWSGEAGGRVFVPYAVSPKSTMAAGEGYLVVPAEGKLTAWHLAGPK